MYTGFCIIQTGYPFYNSLTTVIRILGAVLLIILLIVLVILFVLLTVLAVVVTVLGAVLIGLVQFVVIILCHN